MKDTSTNNQTVLFVLVVILIAAVAQSLYYYPKLQPQISSHFSASVDVDDDQIAKSTLFIIMLSTIFGTALFLTLGTLLALKKVPQLVNIPNKEYWFTPEHKQDTIAFVFKIMVKLTIANTLIMMVILQLIIWGSIGSLESPTIFLWTATGISCVYFLIIVIQLNRRFKLPEAEQETRI
ncbi:MAG: hypothetical protein NZ744_14995 [Pirellulaceae bacterium]|nr:hypothetical protein [Pirellulaceae bacterium]